VNAHVVAVTLPSDGAAYVVVGANEKTGVVDVFTRLVSRIVDADVAALGQLDDDATLVWTSSAVVADVAWTR
jgi:hypothetical protein